MTNRTIIVSAIRKLAFAAILVVSNPAFPLAVYGLLTIIFYRAIAQRIIEFSQ